MGIEVRRGFLSFRMGETRDCLYALESRTSSREYLVEREETADAGEREKMPVTSSGRP